MVRIFALYFLGSIFYGHSVVGEGIYSIYTKMGGTLPVLKNEIKDFFFARLGTGGIYGPPLQMTQVFVAKICV